MLSDKKSLFPLLQMPQICMLFRWHFHHFFFFSFSFVQRGRKNRTFWERGIRTLSGQEINVAFPRASWAKHRNADKSLCLSERDPGCICTMLSQLHAQACIFFSHTQITTLTNFPTQLTFVTGCKDATWSTFETISFWSIAFVQTIAISLRASLIPLVPWDFPVPIEMLQCFLQSSFYLFQLSSK